MLVLKREGRNDMKVELFIRKEVDWLTIWKILNLSILKEVRNLVQRVPRSFPEFDVEIGRDLPFQ